jgi:hypothetical protein
VKSDREGKPLGAKTTLVTNYARERENVSFSITSGAEKVLYALGNLTAKQESKSLEPRLVVYFAVGAVVEKSCTSLFRY